MIRVTITVSGNTEQSANTVVTISESTITSVLIMDQSTEIGILRTTAIEATIGPSVDIIRPGTGPSISGITTASIIAMMVMAISGGMDIVINTDRSITKATGTSGITTTMIVGLPILLEAHY